MDFLSDERSYAWLLSSKFTLMQWRHWHMAFTSEADGVPAGGRGNGVAPKSPVTSHFRNSSDPNILPLRSQRSMRPVRTFMLHCLQYKISRPVMCLM